MLACISSEGCKRGQEGAPLQHMVVWKSEIIVSAWLVLKVRARSERPRLHDVGRDGRGGEYRRLSRSKKKMKKKPGHSRYNAQLPSYRTSAPDNGLVARGFISDLGRA